MTDLRSFRDRAATLDAADPLASYRSEFVLEPDVVAYLDGNSLGRLPRRTQERLTTFVREEWGGRLIRGWSEGWVDLPVTVGDQIGALIGAAPGQTVVADSTSVCLAKALHAGVSLAPGRDRLVVSAADFPTDRYLARRVAGDRGLELVEVDDVAASIDERTAVVLVSHVDYRTGALLDLSELTARVHAAGAVVVGDLCHSAGVVPIDLDATGIDLAVGCTYKYLNGGPGSPAFLYAASRHHSRLEQPLPGWWSADDLFAMADEYRPDPGIRRMLTGTPPVAGLLAVQQGVSLTAESGVPEAREKSELLTTLCIEVLDELGLEVVTPRDPARRGSHVTARLRGARAVAERLTERGVIPDFREPDLLRLGLAPLTTSFGELLDGLTVLAEVMDQVGPLD